MTTSRHYTEYRKDREERIQRCGGEGEIILEVVSYDRKRKSEFLYQLTDKAILLVKPTDRDYLITKYFATASRISRLYQLKGQNPPWWLINQARANENNNY